MRRTWSQIRDLALRPAAGLDSVADLCLLNLDPHDATATFRRLDAAARTARRDGDGRTLAQLRADCALGLLSGTARLTTCGEPIRSPGGSVDRGAAPSPGTAEGRQGGAPREADQTPTTPGARARIQLDAPLTTYLELAAQPGMLHGLGPVAPGAAGTTTWTSPYGHEYTDRPDPPALVPAGERWLSPVSSQNSVART